MSLSEILIKVGGLVLFVVGLCLILSAVGVHLLGISLSPIWLEVLVGVILVGAGTYIVRGGTLTV
jgi:hypothetical protein